MMVMVDQDDRRAGRAVFHDDSIANGGMRRKTSPAPRLAPAALGTPSLSIADARMMEREEGRGVGKVPYGVKNR